MTGALLGLAFGAGLLLLWDGGSERRGTAGRGTRLGAWHQRRQLMIREAGIGGLTSAQLLAAQVGVGFLALLGGVLMTRSMSVSAWLAFFASRAPVAWVGWRRRSRIAELRSVWPDVVDNISSGVRAGLSLPEALGGLADRGPERLRPFFDRFRLDYQASGRFSSALDDLRDRLADPVGDRVVEAVRVAREVGGSDLGRLLRTLSEFLREEARTRSEIEARQSWTVNAARMAVAAPWVVLLLLATQSTTLDAYDEPGGFMVLSVGAAVCLLAYRLMMRLGRLPEDPRTSGSGSA